MGDAFRAVKMDFKAPPLVEAEDLQGFDRPTMVIAAEHDLSFPAGPMMRRAPQLFRNLAKTHVIEGSKHCPPFEDGFRGWLCETVEAFFAGG
jgi:2-hydroxy-6-oxonona-2,4-dienedioate hydrolase